MHAPAIKPVRRTRLVRALELREPAIKIVRRFGKWEQPDKNGPRLFNCNHDGFYISYRTPFNPNPVSPGMLLATGASFGMRPPVVLPYELQVCAGLRRGKRILWAMQLEWDDDSGQTKLRQFSSGDWEERLHVVATRLAA